MFKFNSEKRDEMLENEFLPDVLEITEKPTSKVGSAIIYIIFFMIIIALIWSYVSKVDVVITSRGQILPEGNLRVVQSFKSGTLMELNVSDGDYVNAGDILVKLDTDIEDVDKSYYEGSIDALNYEKNVLNNLIKGNRSILVTDENNKFNYIINYYISVEEDYDVKLSLYDNEIVQNQENLLIQESNLNKVNNYKQKSSNESETLEALLTISELESELEAVVTKIDYAKSLLDKNKVLYDNGVISENEYLASKESYESLLSEKSVIEKNINKERLEINSNLKQATITENDSENDLSIQRNNIELTKLEIKNIQISKENLLAEKQKNYNIRLLDIEKQINDNSSALTKSNETLRLSDINAPISGIIHGLNKNTIGEVIQTGETILTIVPANEELIAQLFIMNKDRADIEVGQDVILKVDAYPFQEFGTLDGSIKNISSNSFFMENIGHVYKVECKIDKDSFENEISSGMEVTGEIVVGQRRVIRYFFDPVIKALDETVKQK